MARESCMEKSVLKLTLSLYNNPHIPRNAVNDVIQNIKSFIADSYVPELQKQVIKEIKKISCNERICSKLYQILEENRYPLQPFETEHQRFQYYERHNGFLSPVPYKIGDDSTSTIINSKQQLQLHPVYGIHLPLKHSITNLLETPGIFEAVEDYISTLKTNKHVISNVMQGRLWEKYIYSDKLVLPLFLFADDFETGNALGSHGGEHSLCGMYVSLPFLPRHLVAKLNNIFVTAIFYKKHRKMFGNNATCRVVINDLNSLASDGLLLKIKERNVTVYFRCALFLGDNLGINSMCGFVESFSATRFCRICKATITECQSMCTEDETFLRTPQNYEEDVLKKCITTGIKDKCVFNDLIDFHIAKNKSVDIMHDLFEGVVSYVISKILTQLIFIDKIFSLDVLNTRVQNFNFGNLESSSKPREITKDISKRKKNEKEANKIKLKQSAAEMLCLCRYLGLIIGDLVPDGYKHWKLYILLREIIAIATAPRFVKANALILRNLIKKHNALYVELMGSLKPKMHFLTHMPEIMLNSGPLVHFWSMPFERKNKAIKDIATSTNCRKNVPLTLATKIQLQQIYNKEFAGNLNDLVLGTIQNLNDPDISTYLPWVKTAKSFKYVEICGKKYQKDTVLISEFTDEGPTFSQIIKIVELANEIYFVMSDINIINFNYKYYAYNVTLSCECITVKKAKSLPQADPCLLTEKETELFIATRYDV